MIGRETIREQLTLRGFSLRKRKRGTVYRRGSTWWVAYHGSDGQRHAHAVGPLKDEAEKTLLEILDVVDKEPSAAEHPIRQIVPTVADYGHRWLDLRKREGLRSISDDRYRFERHVRPVLGLLRLDEVTSLRTRELLANMTAASYRPGTVKQVHQLLRKLYADAIAEGLVRENPVGGLRPPRRIDTGLEWTFLTKAEVERLLSATTTPTAQRVVYATGIFAGLRQGELACLRWEDIDFDRLYRFADEQSQSRETWGCMVVRRGFKGPTKTGLVREVPIHPQLRGLLQSWRQQCPHTSDGLVFPSPKAKRRRPGETYGLRKHLRAIGITRRVRFHDLRHTCGSLLVMDGVPLRVVQAILGHASITTTERYAHLSPEAAAAGLARLRLKFSATSATK